MPRMTDGVQRALKILSLQLPQTTTAPAMPAVPQAPRPDQQVLESILKAWQAAQSQPTIPQF